MKLWVDQSDATVLGLNRQRTSPRDVAEKVTSRLGRFLQIAMGSASELEYQLLLARDLEIIEVA